MAKRIVFFDVDTQLDFMAPAGALAVPGAGQLIPRLAALTQYAVARQYPLISTADAHAENDVEFQSWPAHCVLGTLGQQKVVVTRVPSSAAIPNQAGALADTPAASPQYILEKQTLDAFTNPNLLPLLQRLDAECYVVYGVVTELCVEKALAGLLKLEKQIVLVTDAIQGLSETAGTVIDRYRRHGVVLRTTEQILAGAF